MDGHVDLSLTGDRSATCSARGKTGQHLVGEITTYQVPEHIAARAADIYHIIAGPRIFRELPRRQLIFYGTYLAYHEEGRTPDPFLLGRRLKLAPNEVTGAFTMFSTSRDLPSKPIICTPNDFVIEYAEILGMEPAVTRAARAYIARAVERAPALLELNPCKTCAALIYIFCIENKLRVPDDAAPGAAQTAAFAGALHITPSGLLTTRKQVEDLLARASAAPHAQDDAPPAAPERPRRKRKGDV